MEKIDGINFYLRTRALVHTPNSLGAGSYPLYKRATHTFGSDALVDSGDDLSYEEKAKKDALWSSQINETFSSPRNIKRLFIGVNKSVVHFWAPVVRKGKTTGKLIENFDCKRIVSDSELAAIVKTGSGTSIKASNKRIGLESLKGWALRNVEEIYFDWSALVSREADKSIAGIIQMVYKGSKFENNEGFKKLFINRCTQGKTSESLLREYPRLKRVMFIKNLDKYLDDTAFTGTGSDTVDKMKLDWFGVKGANNFEGFIGFTGVNLNSINDKFSTGLNIYEFDQLYLRDTFNSLSIKIQKFNDEEYAKKFKKDDKPVNKDKGEFEIYLDKLSNLASETCGSEKAAENYMINTLSVVYALDRDGFAKGYAKLTEDGLSKYKTIIAKVGSKFKKQ